MKGGFLKWRVACACAIINFLHLAQMKIIGLQFVATIERYNVDRRRAAFPYVLRFIVSNFSGPLVGFLSYKFGHLSMILSGCFLASFAIGLCYFAEDIIFIIIFWGILNGLGSGMAGHLLPSYMSLHFTSKDLARANGLALTGASLGGFVYPPLYEYLLKTYGTSGAFLILSAYTLNTVPAALILYISSQNPGQTPKRRRTIHAASSFTRSEMKHLVSDGDEKVTCEIVEAVDHFKTDQNIIMEDFEQMTSEDTNLHSHELSKIDSSNGRKTDINTLEKHCTNVIQQDDKIEEFLNETNTKLTGMSSGEELPNLPCQQEANYWTGLRVLYHPLFILTTLTQSSFLFALTLYSTVVVDSAKDKGATVSQSVQLLMCSAVAELAGYLTLGWMTDKGWMSTTNFASLCYFCFGLAVSAFALFDEFVVMLVSIAFSSFVTGGQLLTFPVIVSQYFEEEEKNIVMASRFILFGPMSFALSPLIGFFRDSIGSYEWLFYFLHILSIFSSIFLLFMPLVAKYKK